MVTATVENTTTIKTGAGASHGLDVAASDTAQITSFDGAAAVTANLSDESGDAVSIGIGIARNTIQDSVEASVTNAGQIDATTGANAPVSITATQDSGIFATSLAASLSISAGGENGVAVAGGGSLADNLIGTDTTATLSGTAVGGPSNSTGELTVAATNSSTIDATVAAVSGTVSFGGENGTGVGIGASLAHNRIGDGTDTGTGEVEATITDSTIDSDGINVQATSSQDLSSLVAAGSVALSGGGEAGTGVAGAGAFAFNEVALTIDATIDGGTGGTPDTATADITTQGAVAVAASDVATIDADVLAGSVAGGFGGESGDAVAIGVSFARNSITDPVTAYIENVPSLQTGGGAVSVTAQESASIDATAAAVAIAVSVGGENAAGVAGGGALAANFIDASTEAFISDTTLGQSGGSQVGSVTVAATDSSSIVATIASIAATAGAGGEAGEGFAIGVSIAYNQIADATGFGNGEVSAYITGSSVYSNGDVTVAATSNGEITATTVAVAAALSGGGETGVGVAGAGVVVFNTIAVNISAYIDDTGATQTIAAGGSVTVAAVDTATILSTAGAAAVAASFGGEAGVSVAVGMSMAANVINDPVTAYIKGVSLLTTGSAGVNLSPSTYQVNPGSTQIETVSNGQTVQLAAGSGSGSYTAPDFVDGNSGTVSINPGEIVSNGTALYRYIGSTSQTFTLSSTNFGDTSTWTLVTPSTTPNYIDGSDITTTVIAGQYVKNGSTVYEYTGATPGVFDLSGAADANNAHPAPTFSNANLWTVVASTTTPTYVVGSAVSTSVSANQIVQSGSIFYQYIGSSTVTFDLSGNSDSNGSHPAPNFSNGAIWQQVGATTSALVTPGQVVQSGSNFYRYVGSSAQAFDLSGSSDTYSGDPSPNFSNTSQWAQISGTSGATYKYVGSTPVTIDLSNQNYNSSNWQQVGFVETAAQGTAAQQQTLNVGDTVTVSNTYFYGAQYTASQGTETLAVGARVESADGTVYTYVGQAGSVNLSTTDFDSTSLWRLTPPVASGSTEYKYVGSQNNNPLDLNNQNYATSNLWQQVGFVDVAAQESATIHATTVAAALSVAAGGEAGIAVAGGGAVAQNIIAAETSAYILNSTLGQSGTLVGGVTVTATDDSDIESLVGAVAASVSFGGEAGVGVAIGVSYASNVINDGTVAGTGKVTAYISSSTIDATGLVDVEANAAETIASTTVAAAVALSGGGEAGIGVSGAGVGVGNQSSVGITADISGGSITAGAVTVAASNSSTIDAIAGAAALAAGFGGEAGVAVSIGLSVAVNQIDDPVTADITDVSSLVTGGGAVIVTATEAAAIAATSVAAAVSLAIGGAAGVSVAGGGASAKNIIEAKSSAYISQSTLGTSGSGDQVGAVTVAATDTSSITALIAAVAASLAFGGAAGVGVAIGVSVAFNQITDGTFSGTGAVDAYILDTPMDATGLISIDAQSQQTISAITAAGAVGIAGGGAAGVGVSAAGASDENYISVAVSASLSFDPSPTYMGSKAVTTGGLAVAAKDNSSISAFVGAASVAGGFGGAAGVAVSIGLSIALNTIDDPVTAFVTNVSSLSSANNNVSVTATEDDSISAVSVTASFAAGGGGAAGVAVGGGGASANNAVDVETKAYISGSSLSSVGDVTVNATESGSITALIAAVVGTVGVGGAAGVGVSIGASVAHNTIGNGGGEVYAYILDTPISTSSTGVISVTATSSETVSAEVAAGSAALTAGGAAGVGVSFGGAFGFNEITVSTRGYIDEGTGANDATAMYNISSDGVNVAAIDTANITAGVGAASVAVSLGGAAGVSVTIALSIARNTINDDQQAYISGVKALNAGLGTVSAEVTEGATINAGAIAASLAAGISGVAGVAVSGAATTAENLIEVDANAYIADSSITSAGAVTVESSDTSTINAIVDAASAAVAGGIAGVGVAFGASAAQNYIDNGVIGGSAGQVEAYILNTGIDASGLMTVKTITGETIDADVGTVAAAVTGGLVGVSVGVGVATAINEISINAIADIDGDSDGVSSALVGISASAGVGVSAKDTSNITAEVDSTAVTAAFGFVGVSVSVGVSQATNEINNNIDAYIENATVSSTVNFTTTDGGTDLQSLTPGQTVQLASTYDTSNYMDGEGVVTSLLNPGNVVLSNGTLYRYIGSSSQDFDLTGSQTDTNSQDPSPDFSDQTTWQPIAGTAGAVYQYVGTAGQVDLNNQDYTNTALWKLVPSSVSVATNEGATITAEAASAAVAVSGGAVGVSVAGGGAEATNVILDNTEAYLSGGSVTATGNVSTSAQSTATINADILAASVSAAVGGFADAASIGVGIAENYIGYQLIGGTVPVQDSDVVEAYSSGTSVTAGGAFDETAADTSTINADVAALSAALVAGFAGDSLSGAGATAENFISVDTEATVSGSGASGINVGSIDLSADDQSTIYANVAAVSLAVAVSLGGSLSMSESLAQNTIDNEVQSSISSATVTADGPVTVDAVEDASITAISVAASVSASIGFSGSAGAAVALNTIETDTTAFVGSNSSLTVDDDGAVMINADDTSSATATTGSASIAAGIIAIAAGGSSANDTITNNVAAYIDASTVSASGSAVTVEASVQPEASATAYGVTAGDLAIGTSLASITLTPTVLATVGGPNITVGSLSILANLNLPTDGNPAANAYAGGSSGGIVAAVATNVTTTNNATVTAGLGTESNVASAAGMVIAVAGELLIVANSNTEQSANASNASVGLVAGGVAEATATATNTTTATVGNYAHVTAGTVQIGANGNDNNYAQTIAGSGGVVAGDAVEPTTNDTATTVASVGQDAIVNVTGGSAVSAFDITASHTATTNTRVIADAIGLLSGAGELSTDNITSNVTTGINGTVTALSIAANADNTFDKPELDDGSGDNVTGDTGGLASAAGGEDDVNISFTTLVLVGADANLTVDGSSADPGAISFSAFNNFQGYDQLSFKTGGALAGAAADITINAQTDIAEVDVEDGAQLSSIGQINMAADGGGSLTTEIYANTYGAVTAADTDSSIYISPTNDIFVGTVTPTGDDVVGQGQADTTVNIGDIVEKNGTLYRYVGSSPTIVNFASNSTTFSGDQWQAVSSSITSDLDVSLLAGESAAFVADNYQVNAYEDAFAGSVVPLSDVNANAYVTQTNTVAVYAATTINTGGSANLQTNYQNTAEAFAQAKSSSWVSDATGALDFSHGRQPGLPVQQHRQLDRSGQGRGRWHDQYRPQPQYRDRLRVGYRRTGWVRDDHQFRRCGRGDQRQWGRYVVSIHRIESDYARSLLEWHKRHRGGSRQHGAMAARYGCGAHDRHGLCGHRRLRRRRQRH